ncbi:unnamed protein product [Ceutorhynchus assimilis]|uniref:DUF4806 domain-containing protein n=1 Tax=Ceutorhynchus assimilis TaxID=467358 RepID=A0A9N9M8J9_9CUCU|nr:unnamed protein product [Ceutorhynchus assimilis]
MENCKPNDKEYVEVVPLSWVIDEKECVWPPFQSKKQIESAIKHCITPEKDQWKIYTDFKASKKFYSKFSTASAKANQYLHCSDMEQSSEQEIGSQKRHIKKNLKYNKHEYTSEISTSSDDEGDEPLAKLIPKFPEPSKNLLKSSDNKVKPQPNAVKKIDDSKLSFKSYKQDQTENLSHTILSKSARLVQEKTNTGDDKEERFPIMNHPSISNKHSEHIESGHESESDCRSSNNRNDIEEESNLSDDRGAQANKNKPTQQVNTLSLGEGIIMEILSDNEEFSLTPLEITERATNTAISPIDEDAAGIACNDEENDHNVLKKLVKLTITNNALLREQNQLIKDLNKKLAITNKSTPENEELLERFKHLFPIKDDDALKEVNSVLGDDKEFYNYVLRMISLEGGHNLNEYVRKAMKIIIVDQLAKTYSFKGHKSKKNFSVHTHLIKLITECVRNNEARATTRQIEDQVAVWLTKAQRRLDGVP